MAITFRTDTRDPMTFEEWWAENKKTYLPPACVPEVEAAAIYDAAGSLFVKYSRSSSQLPPETVKEDAPYFDENHLITTERKWPTAKALGYKGTIARL